MKKHILLILVFACASILIVACAANKYILTYETFDDFGKLTISKAIALETSRGAKDVTPTYLVTIGESIYPNEKKFKLASPKTYRKKEGSNFSIETDYHYSATDSTVKVILYQWDYFIKKNNDFLR